MTSKEPTTRLSKKTRERAEYRVKPNIDDLPGYIDIAHRLYRLMARADVNASIVAEETGIPYPTIRAIITGGQPNVSYRMILELSSFFKISPSSFIAKVCPEVKLKKYPKAIKGRPIGT